MDSKPAQNIQDTFLNTVRKDKSPITIYLVSGVKLTGKIRSFDKYSVLLENNAQEQLIFKHAISTVVSGRHSGFGETQLETDRRKINSRLDRIKQQLEAVRRIRRQQRGRREAVPVPTVALVGYTNAGKSTLFNSLTGGEVLASERMFATLDPKLRQLTLPSRRKVLLSDTVGFIRNLPHALVTSFRATLEEVERAELLLHVRDAASPTLDEQRAQVEAVLKELGVMDKPTLQVLNKIDLLPAGSSLLPGSQGDATIAVSALTGDGLDDLLHAIDAALTADPLESVEFRIPQAEGRVLAALERGATITGQRFEGNLVYLNAVGPASLLDRYRRYQHRQVKPLEAVQIRPTN